MDKQTSRTAYAAKNILWGYAGNVLTMLMSFAARTVFIYTIGLTYLGINGLFTNILGILSFTELGIGTAINFSLYKPVAMKDQAKIKSLMQLYRRAYRFIAIIVAGLGVALLPLLPYLIKGAEGIENISLYYLIFLFNTVSSYFITYKYSLVITEQKSYILTNIDSIFKCIIFVVQIVIIVIFKDFLVYLLAQSCGQLIQKIWTSIFIDKKFPYLKDKIVEKLDSIELNTIKHNVKALVVHKLGDISVHQTDNIIISALINITLTGIVSNYNLLIMSVTTFVNIIFNSLTAGFGNVIATESKDKQLALFQVYHFMGFWVYGFTTICFIVLMQPFIILWLGDSSRIDDLSFGLIMINQYLLGQRITMNNFRTAGGIFDADKYISVLQAVVNLVISVVLVNIMGLPGIFIGTLVQGLIPTIWRPIIIYRVMFSISATPYFKDLIKYLLVTAAVAAGLLWIGSYVLLGITVVRFFIMLLLSVVLINVIFYVLFRKDQSFLFFMLKVQSLLKRRRDVDN